MKQISVPVVLLLAVTLVACTKETTSVTTVSRTAAESAAVPTGTEPVPSPAPTSTTPVTSTVPDGTTGAVAPATGKKLLPVDEGTRDASFTAFRDQLLSAISKRDRAALLALVDPQIRTSFGTGAGTSDLVKMWKLDQTGSPIWSELEWIATHGGTFAAGSDSQFWAPYVYSAWPEAEDAFSSVAIVGAEVPLRETAAPSSNVTSRLDHDIVSLTHRPENPADPWQVRTSDGRSGFVDAQSVRSPIGWRAGFMKRNGAWQMNALVAGD